METFLPKWIDQWMRKHPSLTLCCLAMMAIAICLIVIAAGHNRLVYEGF
jgi:MFS-type transporter involved in bile tolerance (Atg22 family)